MDFLLWGVIGLIVFVSLCVLALMSFVIFVFSVLGGEEDREYQDWYR